LVDEDCVIVVAHGHALANSASATLASLAGEKFVLFNRGFSPATYDSIFAACRRAGFTPKLDQEVAQTVSVIPAVAAGFGVSIVPRSFGEIHFAGVSYIDIDGDAPRATLAAACRRDERSAAIKNMMKAVRLAKLARDRDQPGSGVTPSPFSRADRARSTAQQQLRRYSVGSE